MTKRREFIKKSVLGSAGIAVGGMGFTSKSYASIVGANERINVAVVGIRNQGSVHIDTWCSLKENRTPGYLVYGGVEAYGHDKTSQETPNTQTSIFKYGDGKILEFETRGRYTNRESSSEISIGNMFYGTEGYLELRDEVAKPWKAFRRGEKEPFAGSKEDTDPKKPIQNNFPVHFTNFLDAIRSGKDETLTCDIIQGHYSSALPHLGNISYRLGRELKFMGEYEKFAGDSEADTMLTRVYRKPYIIPEEV